MPPKADIPVIPKAACLLSNMEPDRRQSPFLRTPERRSSLP